MKSNDQKQKRLEATFAKAVALHQQGDPEKACVLYKEILLDMPGSPLVHYNLGLGLYDCGKFTESCDHYMQALELVPDEVDILFNLALSLKQAKREQEAEKYYKKILTLQPDDIDTLYNLGCLYKDIGKTDTALSYYSQVLKISPDHLSSLNNSAYLQHAAEDYETATALYRRIIGLCPTHPGAQFMLDTLEGRITKAAPASYVKEVFDSYSTRYDHSLVEELHYKVPDLLLEQLREIKPDCHTSNLAIDLGCGTGLAAEAFSDLYHEIHGVDLSSKMIEMASLKNLYSQLVVGDLESFLTECDSIYELILATDVFTYLGDLDEIFLLIKNISAPQAIFCFSVEESEERRISLRKSGRFSHSQDYILEVCQKAGWKTLSQRPANLRKDKEKWVKGRLYILEN